MFTKSPLALVLLVSASILAAAQASNSYGELRTGVPYYMAPYTWVTGGGVAPARVGNEECPSAVKLTPEVDRGVPIIFSTLFSDTESVVIDGNTGVYISFNATVPCHRNTWANIFYVPMPSTVPLELIGTAAPLIYEPTIFRIEKEGIFYRVYSRKFGKWGAADYNVVHYRDTENKLNRLAISSEKSPLFFTFYEAEDYDRMVESVV